MANEQASLKLTTGRTIELRALEQRLVYEGLLEGLPTREKNRQRLSSYLEQARQSFWGKEPFLLPPSERAIPWPRSDPYPFGEPAALPRVVCTARFHSMEPAREQSMDYSELVVVWFQEDFAFPIDPEVVEKLRALDWGRLAADDCY